MEILGMVFLFIIIFAIAIAYGTLSWGLVMYKFWYWFLLPVFPALPQINYIHAIGLVMFVGLFHTVQTQIIKKEYKDENAGNILAVLAPWVTLFLGWIVHGIFM